MKIRYYLRGLGLGILVTSIFFMVSGNTSRTMSDEMIKARAKELGMSESMVLSELPVAEETTADEDKEEITETSTAPETIEQAMEDVSDKVTEEVTVATEDSEETTVEETTVEEIMSEETVEETVEQESTAVETEEVSEDVENVSSNTETVLIVVNRGDGSDTVSRRMQDAGLVADAYEYDRYLMANGYDKRIGAGEHSIPAGATWEEMAKILCNMR